ncbi:MAG: D-alanyl-D-alanine carboxypeptidase/D-alanyl-D-alanine-endopeptidase [Ignavibacteria bacterium]|nr:D-alanyl-D-alanine carboxypeptidase/D-alanyl-D-alanine-endopeptidase [Ignavibacteria bacterium]
MKICKLLLFFICCISLSAQKKSNISEFDRIISKHNFSASIVGVEIFNLTDSQEVFSKNNKILMRPASNIKILTTAAGLLFLGADYDFETSLFYDGQITDSILIGNVYFKGGFDPSFNLSNLDSLTSLLKISGIKKIKGNIYADISAMDSLYWGNGWMWDDQPSVNDPCLTPLCINRNSVRVNYSPEKTGDKVNVKIVPDTDYFEISNQSVTTNTGKSDLLISRDWLNHSDKIIVKGNLRRNSGSDSVEFNVTDMNGYFLSLAEISLKKNGIVFSGNKDTLTTPIEAGLVGKTAKKFSSIIGRMNKQSDNLYAEMTLRALGLKYYGAPSSAEKGLKMIDSLIFLTGKNPKNYRIADGSGLSHYNLITNELIVSILKYFYYKNPDLYQEFIKSFAVSGTDGTIKNRLRSELLKGKVFAKTGAISAVSTISGIVKTKRGKELAFSIFVNNYVGGAGRARAFQDELLEYLIINY